jgi:hypothetical protein
MISPSDDITTWLDVMDNPVVDGEDQLEISVAVLDHEPPLHDAILHPFYELIDSEHNFEITVHVMNGIVLHSFTMLFNLLDDLNSSITRVYQGKVIDGVFPEWRNAVYAQGCVPEAPKPMLYMLPHFTRHLLPLISYLSGWLTGIMSGVLPMLNWHGIHKYATLTECLGILPCIDVVMVINQDPGTPSSTLAAECHRDICVYPFEGADECLIDEHVLDTVVSRFTYDQLT